MGFRSAAAGSADALHAAGAGVRERRLRPTDARGGAGVAVEAAKKAFCAKLQSLDAVEDETGQRYGDRLLSLVMLNVLDEKWKDHLYDLDQLRNAIHYRSWGQKDPLIEYKQEAYTMFVDLMNDIYNTFSERFLKVQLVMEQPAPPPPTAAGEADEAIQRARDPRGHSRRRAFEPAREEDGHGRRTRPRRRAPKPVAARKDPTIVGAGRLRSLDGNGDTAARNRLVTVGRNDPCPCGSGKKFKKCHGVNL